MQVVHYIRSKMRQSKSDLKFSSLFLIMIVMGFVGFLCIFPYIVSIIISLTPSEIIYNEGYKIFPSQLDLSTYKFIMISWRDIAHAYLVTIVVTVIGSFLALSLTMSCAYVLSRKEFKYKKIFTIYIFITMLLNAGMTANYMIMTQALHVDNTIWALILPLCINPFWIFICKTYIQQSVPDAIIESAKIDGANEFIIFLKVVLPVCKPVIATIGLFSTLLYWNDWFNAKLYITDSSLYTLQYYLVKMQDNIKFMKENASLLGAQAGALSASLPDDTIIMAVMVVVTIPLVLCYPFFQRYFVEGLTIGAVK